MIGAVDIDRAAHFEQARTRPCSDAILKVFAALVDAVVWVISRKDGEFTVVVTSVNNVRERVLHPIRRF